MKAVFFTVAAFFLLSMNMLHSQTVKDEDVKVVCDNWPPYEFRGEDGKLTGFSIELLQAMFKELKINPKIRVYPWPRVYKLVLNEKNTLAFTMARIKKREKLFKWVGPIAPRKIYLWKLKSRTDIKVKNWEDVKKYKIGTQNLSASQFQLLSMGFELHKNVIPLHSVKLNFEKLYRGRIDFTIALEYEVHYETEGIPLKPDDLEKVLLLSEGINYYYAFSKDTDDYIVEAFSKALDEVKRKGIYRKIASRYPWIGVDKE